MEAARRLCDATRDLQWAVWSFYEMHANGEVVRIVRDEIEKESRILDKVGEVFKIFTQDYDFPPDLLNVVRTETQILDLGLCNMKAFSMTRQFPEMHSTAKGMQDSCERIREAARPYAYRGLS